MTDESKMPWRMTPEQLIESVTPDMRRVKHQRQYVDLRVAALQGLDNPNRAQRRAQKKRR